jgi:hypothetical protein
VVADELTPMSELCRRAHGDAGPQDALSAIGALRERLDALERQHVADMLATGAHWPQIGRALGISRQAAHRRFRDVVERTPSDGSSTQVQRILVTGNARSTVKLAKEEAAVCGAAAVGTEHLLIALVRNAPARVARALGAVGVDEQRLRDCLQPTVVGIQDHVARNERFTRYAREVLEGSLREAVERGEGYIGTDHLLLALLRNPDGGAAQTLAALGVEPATVSAALERSR